MLQPAKGGIPACVCLAAQADVSVVLGPDKLNLDAILLGGGRPGQQVMDDQRLPYETGPCASKDSRIQPCAPVAGRGAELFWRAPC